MSTDRVTLAALTRHTRKELRYFELISLRFEGRTDQIFLCIGKHALHLVKRNLAGLYLGEKGGEIFFAHVERLVEDSQSDTDMLIVMNENRPSQWPSATIFIVSENRGRLVEHLAVAWQTDHAWRKGRIVSLPRGVQALRKKPEALVRSPTPFMGHQRICHQGYHMFLPKGYAAKALRSGTVRSFYDEARELEVSLRVEEPEPLADIEVAGHDHIRWVATDFRQAATEDLSDVMVLRNAFYLKKMNLANDIACWTGWEVLFKSESCAMAAIFFRRQYIPPMLDAAQDMSIVLRCPVHTLVDGIATEMDLLHEVRVIADSLTPLVQDCTQHQTLYRDMIQAKIDALLFPEDALTWLDSVFHLKDHSEQSGALATLRRPDSEIEAWTFLKSIMTVLQEENHLSNPEVLNMCPLGLPVLSKPISVCDLVMKKMLDARERQSEGTYDREHDPVMNAWLARVARFFAHCVDGFLLRKHFTLCDIAGVSIVAEKTRQKIDSALLFMLHARPKDMTEPFVVATMKHLLHDPGFPHDFTYNDRVMQSLLELGWIGKSLSSVDVEEDAANCMSMDCAIFLSRLLRQTSSANLKAAICRQLISNRNSQVHFATLLPAVMETFHERSLYLKTYATVTLINLSRGRDEVKGALMKEGIGWMVADNLKLQDDDLTHYSLVLLANLTKHVSHRVKILESHPGLVDALTRLLRASACVSSKQQIVAEVASVIGQLCLDDSGWSVFCRDGSMALQILMDIHDDAALGSTMKSKVMFALRQFCSKPKAPEGLTKEAIGLQVIPKVADELLSAVERVRTPDDALDLDHDCINNAVHLLTVLTPVRKNCELMVKTGMVEALEELMASPLCHTESTPRTGAAVVSVLPESTCEQLHILWSALHLKFTATEAQPQTPAASRARGALKRDMTRGFMM